MSLQIGYDLKGYADRSDLGGLNLWAAQIPSMKQANVKTVRLGFSFPASNAVTSSEISYTYLDSLLSLFAQNGVSAILCVHNWQDMQGYFGSQAWRDSWAALASAFKNDSRIKAFELFNEPDPITFAPGVTSVLAEDEKCIDAIRATGDSHLIILQDPTNWLVPQGRERWTSDYYSSPYYRSNTAVTFHRWIPESYTTQAQFDELWNYCRQIMDDWKAAGAVWLGELGYFEGAANIDFQDQWVKVNTDWAKANGVDFNIWFGGSSNLAETWSHYIIQVPLIPPTPTPVASGTASVGGYTFGGYEAILPPQLTRQLWKLREKFISKEVHKKLHPLV